MQNGKDLNAWRKRMGFTISEAAKALGINKSHLIDNLYHPHRPPTARTLMAATNLEKIKNLETMR